MGKEMYANNGILYRKVRENTLDGLRFLDDDLDDDLETKSAASNEPGVGES